MILSVAFILIIIALTFGYFWFRLNFSYWTRHNIPNIPGFLSGKFIDIITHRTNFSCHLHSIYFEEKFQNDAVVGIYAPHRPALLIRDPDLLKLIFTTDFHHFRNRFARSDPYRDPFGSVVLILARYKFWRKMRSNVGAVFSGGKLKQMYPLMQVVAENLEKSLLKKRAKVFEEETEHFLRNTITFLVNDKELSGVKRNDLIDVFLKLKLEALANGEDIPIFMDGIAATAGALMVAGYDTSSGTLRHALFELAKHSHIQKRLREEIVNAFLEGKGEITLEALNELEYLGMVLDESLRMYPVAHLLEREHDFGDGGTLFSLQPYFNYTLPPGMPIYISVTGLHNDPKYWPNPDIFDPERFTAENKKSRHQMVYMPFGHGPRNCVGGRFGLLQVKLGLALFLRNHSVQICDQTNLNPEFDANALVPRIKGGVHLQIVKDNLYDIIM